MFAIMDIIILPENATQTVTVTYTKYDETTTTVTSDPFYVSGKVLGTEKRDNKYMTKYFVGINFLKTISDAKPGTTFEFTVTTNYSAGNESYFEEKFTYSVLDSEVMVR